MKKHNPFRVAVIALMFLGAMGIAQADTWTFNMPKACTSQNAAGQTIRVTGEGAFDPTSGSVLGSGNYSIRNAGGKIIGHGSWSATSFGSFHSDGGLNNGAQGGTLTITVTLYPDGGTPSSGVPMTIICAFANGAFDEEADAALVGDFTTRIDGETVFHIEK